jgi:hypothetical protein
MREAEAGDAVEVVVAAAEVEVDFTENEEITDGVVHTRRGGIGIIVVEEGGTIIREAGK